LQDSLVGKIASGPYLAHKRNENKIVWQLPAKRQKWQTELGNRVKVAY